MIEKLPIEKTYNKKDIIIQKFYFKTFGEDPSIGMQYTKKDENGKISEPIQIKKQLPKDGLCLKNTQLPTIKEFKFSCTTVDDIYFEGLCNKCNFFEDCSRILIKSRI